MTSAHDQALRCRSNRTLLPNGHASVTVVDDRAWRCAMPRTSAAATPHSASPHPAASAKQGARRRRRSVLLTLCRAFKTATPHSAWPRLTTFAKAETRRQRRPAALLAFCCALLATALMAPPAWTKTIHKERSLYQTILVNKSASIICLQFSLRRAQRNQSCRDERQPKQMVLSYTKMMMAGLLLKPAPNRILMIGLGGGVLAKALAELYPQAAIDVVEIDAAVVGVAQRFFDFAASAQLRVMVQDGRVFTRRAAASAPASYDLVLLDAFGADYIPEHLMTVEFLQEVKALLAEDGVLAANTFASSALYDHESATYHEVFGPFLNLRLPDSGNRVIFASKGPLPSLMGLQVQANALERQLRPYGIDIHDYPTRLSAKMDWDADARPLTDQYSPANLLQGR